MKYVFDTSSLHRLVIYYLPFDDDGVLIEYISDCIAQEVIIIPDKIFEECRYVDGGIIVDSLPILNSRGSRYKTDSLVPLKRHFGLADNQYMNKDIVKSKGLTAAEVETIKGEFLQSPDFSLVRVAEELKAFVVSDESPRANDSKAFKKVPILCDYSDVVCVDLPKYLADCPVSIIIAE